MVFTDVDYKNQAWFYYLRSKNHPSAFCSHPPSPRLACICWVYSCGMVRMSGTAPGWTPVGSRGGGRWELLVFLLHLARFARALRGDWHRLGKRTDGFYFVDNRITPDSYNIPDKTKLHFKQETLFLIYPFSEVNFYITRCNFDLSVAYQLV